MDEEFKQSMVQRLSRLEVAVENHIPSQLGQITAAVRVLDAKFWAVILLVLAAAAGVWFR